MKLRLLLGAAFGLLGLVLAVQAQAPAQTQAAQLEPATQSLKGAYSSNRRNIIGAAEKMPAEHYSFKPTSDVRSFAEILGHIAFVNYLNCAVIKGEANPNKENFEKSLTAKEDVLKALKASFDYCDGGFNTLSDATMKESYKMGAREIPKASQVVLNAVHNMEHYGNLVTYLRLKGIVPPSSEPRTLAPAKPENKPPQNKR